MTTQTTVPEHADTMTTNHPGDAFIAELERHPDTLALVAKVSGTTPEEYVADLRLRQTSWAYRYGPVTGRDYGDSGSDYAAALLVVETIGEVLGSDALTLVVVDKIATKFSVSPWDLTADTMHPRD